MHLHEGVSGWAPCARFNLAWPGSYRASGLKVSATLRRAQGRRRRAGAAWRGTDVQTVTASLFHLHATAVTDRDSLG